MRLYLLFLFIYLCLSHISQAQSPSDSDIKWTKPEIEQIWKKRLESFLSKGVIPIIDMESTINDEQSRQLSDSSVIKKMDALGIALIAFDVNQAPPNGSTSGYRWGYHMHQYVISNPDRFILTTNAGVSPNWRNQKSDMIQQTEEHVRTGKYALIGEFEFRHYVSQDECKNQRYDREVDIQLNSQNGHRLFALSSETGIPFLIHNEPEDDRLDVLAEMLAKYPNAKVIQAHFGQIRYPNREKIFSAEYVRNLLTKYPNLYFDISVGEPGRIYECQGQRLLDTVIWESATFGQRDRIKPEYLSIFNDFSDRFVSGMDYGGGGPPLTLFWETRVKNIRLILRDLPEKVQHKIAYQNAWRLLTGKIY
mgnify:FL=1